MYKLKFVFFISFLTISVLSDTFDISVNFESGYEFKSQIALAQEIRKLKSKKEDILICNIDFKKVENARQHWPFLRDRRIDAYKGINM